MKIALRHDNFEQFNVFLNDVQWDTEDDKYIPGPDNCFVEVPSRDLLGLDTVDFADILEASLNRLTDDTGFCILDCQLDRIVYIDKKNNTRIILQDDRS